MQSNVEKLFMATHSRPPTDEELQKILSVARALECKDNDAFIGVLAALESYSSAYDTQIRKISEHCNVAANSAAQKAADAAEQKLLEQQSAAIEKIANRIHRNHAMFKSWYVYGCTIAITALLTFGGIWVSAKDHLATHMVSEKERKLNEKEQNLKQREAAIQGQVATIKTLQKHGFEVFTNAVILPDLYKDMVTTTSDGRPIIYTK